MSAIRPRRKEEKPEEINQPSILQLLADEYQQKSEEEPSSDVAVLFCGSRRAGKTSLVERFINPTKDDKDQPKPTIALEYKFARYAAESGTSKALAHIYDLGGDESNEGLVAIPITAATVGSLVLVLTVDLSEPHTVGSNLERWLALLRDQVGKSLSALASSSPANAQRVEAMKASKAQLYSESADLRIVKPFPIPLVIFGTKYDVFSSDVDPEKKKGLCRALRFFAHQNGASLVTCSLKDKGSMTSVRNLLRQLLFGVGTKGGLAEQLDASKPIAVSAGKDTFASIGSPGGNPCTDKGWVALLNQLFPDASALLKKDKRTEAEVVGEELVKYPEATVDGMVEQRIEELNQYRRQVERNQRLASEGVDTRKVTVMGS